MTADHLCRREPHRRVLTVQLSDDHRDRFPSGRTKGTDRINRFAVAPTSSSLTSVIRSPSRQPSCALIEKGSESPEFGSRRFISQHATNGRYTFGGSWTKVTNGRKGSELDVRVTVIQAGSQRLHGTCCHGADLSQCQGRTSTNARLRGFRRPQEQLNGRPADQCQCLGNLIDAAIPILETVEQQARGRPARPCQAGTRRVAKLRRSSPPGEFRARAPTA